MKFVYLIIQFAAITGLWENKDANLFNTYNKTGAQYPYLFCKENKKRVYGK